MTLADMVWWRLTATITDDPGPVFNHNQNAVWIAHTWVGDPHSDDDLSQLGAELQREDIHFVFAHVGPLDNDGTIPLERYPYAQSFVQRLHAVAPGIQVLAWIGQIYEIGALPDGPQVDLSLSATRNTIVTTTAHFINDLGFDGVHYDLEPVPNNDNHFLDLLTETRAALRSGALISVAAPKWVPVARIDDLLRGITNRQDTWWTTYYYQRVSQLVDQIVVMMYNTGMPTPPLYEAMTEQETAHILRAVQSASAATTVLMGIPTYPGPNSRAFHAQAENMLTGLRGVTAGLNYQSDHPAFAGVAIYPEWLTTADDWSTYDRLWLGVNATR